ncbi:MAG: hypothetical protein Q4B79_06845 [Moraxella sp.]|uniref:hypothetical protein n=1 Tax=Moraxella sp. TaxID=479 RepID=UPI0026DCB006|nr:hypothetical protein [Moraxella sp.]MDO4450655.1 hypothetical protein [Moraxella sp.]
MLIELPPHIEQLVIAQAQSEQLSVVELIEKWASENQKTPKPNWATVYIKSLPKLIFQV